jgi:hypothetical protein
VRYGRARASPFCVVVVVVVVVDVVDVVDVAVLWRRREEVGWEAIYLWPAEQFSRGWLIVRSLNQSIYTVELNPERAELL